MDCHMQRGGVSGCKMFMTFHVWSPSDFPKHSASVRAIRIKARFSQRHQQCYLFFIVMKIINQKSFFIILICTSLITGEQRIQKKGLARLMCHWQSPLERRTAARLQSQGPSWVVPFAGVPVWMGGVAGDTHHVHETVWKWTVRGQVNILYQNVT